MTHKHFVVCAQNIHGLKNLVCEQFSQRSEHHIHIAISPKLVIFENVGKGQTVIRSEITNFSGTYSSQFQTSGFFQSVMNLGFAYLYDTHITRQRKRRHLLTEQNDVNDRVGPAAFKKKLRPVRPLAGVWDDESHSWRLGCLTGLCCRHFLSLLKCRQSFFAALPNARRAIPT